jgi:protein-tyrosine phosphatase
MASSAAGCSAASVASRATGDQADMHLIVDGLFLGSMFAAYDADLLKKQKVTAVLSCAEELPVREDVADLAGIKHGMRLPMVDRPDFEDAELCFREGAATINRWVSRGEIVLCHCAAGVSRSASCVVAYLMLHRGLRFEAALAHVKLRRGIVAPNSGFIEVLKGLKRA